MIPVELVAFFTLLQAPETRAQGRAKLAEYSGVEHVLLFGKDTEIGQFLPALGQPQTLRNGLRWQQFLRECGLGGVAKMPDPNSGEEIVAYGMTDLQCTAAIVFLGAEPGSAELAQIAALLPLLGAKLVLERNLLAADGHAEAAREANRRASALNGALEINRRELQVAYQKAESELFSRRIAEQKLRDTDRRKDEFLAMLAHELRNPLAPISIAARVLKLGSSDPERLLQSCNVIERQVGHMNRLLDDLLDVSRVTGGMVTLASSLVNMCRVVSEAMEQARPLIDARGHKLRVILPEVEVFVTGDDTRLVQIVTNLLNNAAKYTPSAGEISLLLAQLGEDVILTVRDNGIGIDADLLPHVFDLFVQGERSTDRSQGGLGLGLALVKRLAERHGGSVQARSAGKHMGSEFQLTLPGAPREATFG